jgi:hypothetical protein
MCRWFWSILLTGSVHECASYFVGIDAHFFAFCFGTLHNAELILSIAKAIIHSKEKYWINISSLNRRFRTFGFSIEHLLHRKRANISSSSLDRIRFYSPFNRSINKWSSHQIISNLYWSSLNRFKFINKLSNHKSCIIRCFVKRKTTWIRKKEREERKKENKRNKRKSKLKEKEKENQNQKKN